MSQPATGDSPMDLIRRLYEDSESFNADAMEKIVNSNGFSELLALSTSNILALIRLGNTGMDQFVRSLRLAGRVDMARLGRQQARTEDKLELVLQAVEKLESRMAAIEKAVANEGHTDPAPARKSTSSNGAGVNNSAAVQAARAGGQAGS